MTESSAHGDIHPAALLVTVCATPLEQLCHTVGTVVPCRWHSCATPLEKLCHAVGRALTRFVGTTKQLTYLTYSALSSAITNPMPRCEAMNAPPSTRGPS